MILERVLHAKIVNVFSKFEPEELYHDLEYISRNGKWLKGIPDWVSSYCDAFEHMDRDIYSHEAVFHATLYLVDFYRCKDDEMIEITIDNLKISATKDNLQKVINHALYIRDKVDGVLVHVHHYLGTYTYYIRDSQSGRIAESIIKEVEE